MSSSKLFRTKTISNLLNESQNSKSGLKKTLSATNLVALGVGAIIGTGIFVITGTAAAKFAGPALTISFFISAIGCVMAALCYAEFSSMIPIAGSAYSYSYATMGESVAWFIGWNIILEYMFAASTVAVGWSGYMISFLNDLNIHIPAIISRSPYNYVSGIGWIRTGSIINFPAIFIVILLSTTLMQGMKQMAWVNNIIVIIKTCIILLFIGFGISYINIENWDPYIPENTGSFGHFGWSGILRGAGVIFFAYLGFDAISTVAQETKNPQKDMPKGILISLAICTFLYIAVTAVLTGIVNYTELNVSAPIALAFDKVQQLSWLSPFIKIGAIAGLSSVVLVLLMAQSRIFYAISADGLIPPIFSKVDKKYGAPRISIILSTVCTALIAGFVPIDILGELVSIGTLFAFMVVCIAIIILRRTRPDLHRPFKTPFSPFVPIAGAIICFVQMLALPIDTWIRLAIWMSIGFIIYFSYSIKNSKLNK